MLDVVRSARLVSWGNAALAGRVSLDTAAERIVDGDVVHRLVGLPQEPGPVSLPLALARLRGIGGISGLRLALPVPGDPSGLPGPVDFTVAAVAAGEAVLTVGHPALGLLPAAAPYAGPLGRGMSVRWDARPVSAGPAGVPPAVPTLSEAERALKEALGDATEALIDMDLARWRPELAEWLHDLRADRAMAGVLAPGYPPRAAAVLGLARRVGGIAALAQTDDGASASAGQLTRRTAVLRELAAASRTAQVAAFNAVLEPVRG